MSSHNKNEGLSIDKIEQLNKQDGYDNIIPSSDVETEKMDDMENKGSNLEELSREGEEEDRGKSGNVIAEDQKKEQNNKEVKEAKGEEKAVKEVKGEEKTVKEVKTEENAKGQPEIDSDSDEEMEDADEDEAEPEVEGEMVQIDEEKKKEAEMEKQEAKRITAMNELKGIEIEFAKLKDKLYETQLKKLEFELKLCEWNRHPDFLYFMKLIDENFKGQIEKSIELQKDRLRCLDNETKAYRVQIHQQFIKNCEDLKYRRIREITSEWYEINKERRAMDTASIQSPEYYQFNNHMTASNVGSPEVLNDLVCQRNALYREIGQLKGIVKFKGAFPSSLNNMTGCKGAEIDDDLAQMGILH